MRNLRSTSGVLLGLDGDGDEATRRRRQQAGPTDAVMDLLRTRHAARVALRAEERARNLDRLRRQQVSEAYLRRMPRRWQRGDVYAPHDLSPEEAARWRKPVTRSVDIMDILGVNPLDEYRVRVWCSVA